MNNMNVPPVWLMGQRFSELGSCPLPSELLKVERTPWNRFDDNALVVRRVSDGKTCGFVDRRSAAWLSPLVDEGSLRIKRAVCTYPVDKMAPLLLDLVDYD